MVVNFSSLDLSERPILILKNASDTPLGVLGYAKNVTVDLKYNETSTIEFEVPGVVNGESTPFYDDIAGLRTVELRGVGQFTLISPSETGDGVQKSKSCKGYSLEYEFVYKKITLPEGTYKFWDELSPEDSLLGMLMDLMPSWSIGSVSSSLMDKYRTFEVSNENLYNLIKGTIQKSYNCIFDFDTSNRKVYVYDASSTPNNQPVFLSLDNLAKEIELTENTEDIFTRLDVNGADGVTIRDVNPTGTNKIINLDYYMTEENFPFSLIEKYSAWKQLYAENKLPYYSLSVQYAIKTALLTTERAKLTDLQGEMISLENLRAVAIQGIAQGIKVQSDLDAANANISAKQGEIAEKQSEIDSLQEDLVSIHAQLKTITEACNFEKYFTESEYKLLDRYIKDGEISEPSFVVSEVSTYGDEGSGKKTDTLAVAFSGATITQVTSAGGTIMYDIRGGRVEVDGDLEADVISAVIEQQTSGAFVATAYLSSGSIADKRFQSGCASFTGDTGSLTASAESATLDLTNGYRYFTFDASEYERRSVAWELYEYGEEALNKMSAPSYSFKITSANFLAIEDFVSFRDALRLGEKAYIDMGDQGILQPIVIGVHFSYDDLADMELLFSDSYTASDSTFRLVDLLEQSISMGKNVETSKLTYSSFVDSGASDSIREFMTSALDVARNAIIASGNQAISLDGAGLRLRKYANEAQTAYADEQIWMNNNSILMTSDGWATAQMAIGKFQDETLGDCWGIVAPHIVGTLLAGKELIIESTKKEGGSSVFRVDGNGVRIRNGDLSISTDSMHIVLNPDVGLVIGEYPVCTKDEESGVYSVDGSKAKFWADADGNLNFAGALHGATGDFTGEITATKLSIDTGGVSKPINEYISENISDTIDSFDERLTAAELKVTESAIISAVTESAEFDEVSESLNDAQKSAKDAKEQAEAAQSSALQAENAVTQLRTTVTQTASALSVVKTETSTLGERVTTIESGVHIDGSTIGLYRSDSPYKSLITNAGWRILEGSTTLIDCSKTKLTAPRVVISDMLVVGNAAWKPGSDKHLRLLSYGRR